MTDASDIKIFDMVKMDLTGAVIIEGFPSVGLVSSIVADYIITTLELEQIGVVDSERFPTISLVRDGVPFNPVRIYGGTVGKGGSTKLVVFISEFQPPQGMIRAITTAVLDWMQEQKCTLLISPEGFVIGESPAEDTDGEADPHAGHLPEGIPKGDLDDLDSEELKEKLAKAIEKMRASIHAYGVGCTENANALLEKYDVPVFEEGVISGVSGVLLNEGKRRNLEVVCLLAEAHPDYPDARAAAKILETIDNMLLKIDIDPMPLYIQAIAIEKHIQLAQAHSESKTAKPSPVYGYG